MLYLELRKAINKLKLDRHIASCKPNSDKLQDYFQKGQSRSGAFLNIDGMSPEGHYFYVQGDFVVDLVLHNYENGYSIAKGCETSTKGIFHKDCYFKKLNVDARCLG